MNKISPNLTVTTVAEKNRSKLPPELGNAYKTINDTIDSLDRLKQIPDVVKTAKLSQVTRREYESASSALVAYKAGLEDDLEGFEKTINDLSAPQGEVEMMEHLSLRTALLGGNESLLKLAYKDETVAKVCARLPDSLKQQYKLKDEILKETYFKGYNEEVARYNALLDNCDRAERHLSSELGKLIDEDAEDNLKAFQTVG